MRLFSITKPGIIFGNVITASGGFFLATRHHFDFLLFVVTIVGMGLIIACGCVFNNCIDRDIDQLMKRTRKRAIVQGEVSIRTAVLFGTALGIAGALLLGFMTNLLTLTVALTGLFVYVVVYSLWFKRNSLYGTAVGGIAGAVPPMVGYCAVANTLDAGAWILFIILFLWQIPHSYAIGMFRSEDYSAANIPVMPVVKNIQTTKVYMALFSIAFAIAILLPTIFGYTGLVYLVVASITGLVWLYQTAKGFYTQDDRAWARKLFGTSILSITILCAVMIIKI